MQWQLKKVHEAPSPPARILKSLYPIKDYQTWIGTNNALYMGLPQTLV
jgi:hypothetical protein